MRENSAVRGFPMLSRGTSRLVEAPLIEEEVR